MIETKGTNKAKDGDITKKCIPIERNYLLTYMIVMKNKTTIMNLNYNEKNEKIF